MGNTHVNLSAETLDTSTKYLRQDSIDDVKAIFQKLQTKQKDSAKHSIDRNTFGTFFRYDSKITDNLFNTFDQDGNGTIDSDEFLRGMALCSSGSLDSKIKFCFNAYDASGDGNLQKKELEGMLQSTAFSSFAILEAVGRSLDISAQKTKDKKDHPLERLKKKAAFKKEVEWMVREAYRNSDKNDDNDLDYEEFFNWVVNSSELMEVLYGTFQLRKETTAVSGKAKDFQQQYSSLFRSQVATKTKETGESMNAINQIQENKKSNIVEIDNTRNSDLVSQLARQQSDASTLRDLWRYWGKITFGVSMFGLLLMVVERIILHHVFNDRPNIFTSTFRYIVSIDCVVLTFCLLRWTLFNIKLQKNKGHLNPMATICSTPYVRQRLCFDILVALIHVPPHAMEELHEYPGLQYWLTNALSWAMLLRIYLLPSMLQQHFIQVSNGDFF